MRIKKKFQGTIPENKILDTYSSSNTDTYSCNQVNKLNSYSTTEQRIGTWIDGKSLYRKTFDVDLGTATYYELNVSDLKIENVMFDTSHSYFIQDIYRLQFGFYAGATDWARMYSYTNAIVLQFGNSYTSKKTAVVTIEYTKTTD